MTITLDDLLAHRAPFALYKNSLRGTQVPLSGWYPYDSASNLVHLDKLLRDRNRDFDYLSGGARIADIGAGDGDLAFMLAQKGFGVDIIDHAMTNFNHLEGARKLKDLLQVDVQVHDVDLDSQFELPKHNYGLVIFLGILYHLQNPFYALKRLAQQSNYLILSTRITRFDKRKGRDISGIPLGYLLGERESNNDPTNYWIFTRTGLERLFERTGWIVEAMISVGDLRKSEPADMNHDERCFALLRSRAGR